MVPVKVAGLKIAPKTDKGGRKPERGNKDLLLTGARKSNKSTARSNGCLGGIPEKKRVDTGNSHHLIKRRHLNRYFSYMGYKGQPEIET